MSLSTLHVFFILISILVSFGFGFWAQENPGSVSPWMGKSALMLGWVLAVYLLWFIRKLRKDSFKS